jgi:uncharacterized protein YxeA
MKKIMSLMLGLSLVLATGVFAADTKKADDKASPVAGAKKHKKSKKSADKKPATEAPTK